MMNWEPVGPTLDVFHYDDETRRATAQPSSIWAEEVIYDAEYDGGYYHEYNTETGIILSGEEDYGTVGLNENDRAVVYTAETTETVYKYAYPHYYAKYQFFNPEIYNVFSNANGGSDQGGVENNTHYAGYTGSIDPHPYVDTDGTKYLYWVDNIGENRICVVEMEN